LDKKASIDPDKAALIEGRLGDFAFIHGISERMEQLKIKVAQDAPRDITNELPDEQFGLILDPMETASGERERRYPMRNALEVKKCAEYLKEYQADFPYKYRQKIAANILSCAEKYGAGLGDLDSFIEKQAGQGSAATLEVGKLLFDRARLLKRAGKIEFAIKLAEMAKTVTGRDGALNDSKELVKLACLVDDVDRETGLNRMVDDLPRPEDVFFNLTEKVASTVRSEHFSTTSGNIYKLADIEKLSLADVQDLMGTEFANAISTGGLFVSPEKVAEVVPTLPRGDAELFDRLLTSVGINPTIKKAAYEKTGFDTCELKALATLHRGI
jgi:hypothetical protein